MRGVSVPLKFQREGITYEDLSEEEKEDWDAAEWDEDGKTPDRVEAAAVNKWLTEGASSESLGKRLFRLRLELIGELDRLDPPAPPVGPTSLRTGDPLARLTPTQRLRADIATLLRTEVAAMNLENFIVRPKRKLVEQYAQPEAWNVVSDDARRSLSQEVAGLSNTARRVVAGRNALDARERAKAPSLTHQVHRQAQAKADLHGRER